MTKITEKILPAIPPEDYKGTMADWEIKLQEKGLWNGKGWWGDVKISNSDYCDLLEECEND